LADTLRHAWLPSMATGSAALLLLLPLKWLLPADVTGTLTLVCMALLSLGLAGLAFIISVDERAALLASVRRLYPGA
jgi:hypothetical protein